MDANFFDFENCSPSDDIYCQITSWILKVVPPIILVFGSTGNILSVFILLKKRIRKQPTFIFFIFLCLFDCLSLLVMVFRTSSKNLFGIDLNAISTPLCVSFMIMVKVLRTISVYLLAMIALERVIFIRFPVKAREILTNPERIGAVIAVIIFVATIQISVGLGANAAVHKPTSSNISLLYVNSRNNGSMMTLPSAKCSDISSEFAEHRQALLVLFTLSNHMLPMSAIVIGNAMVIQRIVALKAKKRKISRSTSRTRSKTLSSSTRTALVITGYFIATFIPFFVFRISVMNFLGESDGYSHVRLVENILYIIMLMGHAGNFIIYFCTGSAFKEQLRFMLQGFVKWTVFRMFR